MGILNGMYGVKDNYSRYIKKAIKNPDKKKKVVKRGKNAKRKRR